jgi:hypothetical protein
METAENNIATFRLVERTQMDSKVQIDEPLEKTFKTTVSISTFDCSAMTSVIFWRVQY